MFDRRDTQAVKGIAIIAMVIHHFYLSDPAALIKINRLGDVIKVFGATGKVCVAPVSYTHLEKKGGYL